MEGEERNEVPPCDEQLAVDLIWRLAPVILAKRWRGPAARATQYVRLLLDEKADSGDLAAGMTIHAAIAALLLAIKWVNDDSVSVKAITAAFVETAAHTHEERPTILDAFVSTEDARRIRLGRPPITGSGFRALQQAIIGAERELLPLAILAEDRLALPYGNTNTLARIIGIAGGAVHRDALERVDAHVRTGDMHAAAHVVAVTAMRAAHRAADLPVPACLARMLPETEVKTDTT